MEDEIVGATEGFADVLEFLSCWGAADDIFTGDAYQYSGLYPWIINDAESTNVEDVDAVVALSNLDNMIAASKGKYRGADRHQYVFIMSQKMLDKVSGLQTRVQRWVDEAVFHEGALKMRTYNGVPILSSGFVSGSATASVSGLGATAVTSGGSLADATYRVKVAAITLYGEQMASAGGSAAVSGGGGAGSINLSWTANSNAKLYAIYRTLGGEADDDDNYDLVNIINAKTYDSAGAVSGNRTTYTITGSETSRTVTHPLGASEECIFLANLDKVAGMARPILNPTLGDPVDELIHFVEMAKTSDAYKFLLKSYQAVQVPWGALHAVARRVAPA